MAHIFLNKHNAYNHTQSGICWRNMHVISILFILESSCFVPFFFFLRPKILVNNAWNGKAVAFSLGITNIILLLYHLFQFYSKLFTNLLKKKIWHIPRHDNFNMLLNRIWEHFFISHSFIQYISPNCHILGESSYHLPMGL